MIYSKKYILVLAIGLLSLPLIGSAQNSPLTCDNILKLLDDKMAIATIIEVLQVSGTSCDLEGNTELMMQLLDGGADKKLLEAMRQLKTSEAGGSLKITAPLNNAEAGALVKVEGTGEPIKGKHLWLFAKMKSIQNWWPQGGEVTLEDGEWVQAVFIGEDRDIGFDFEILAQWVSDRADRELKDYLTKTSKTGKYYSIPLPEGSQACSIVVHKVSH